MPRKKLSASSKTWEGSSAPRRVFAMEYTDEPSTVFEMRVS
jgi:hypothetical protein